MKQKCVHTALNISFIAVKYAKHVTYTCIYAYTHVDIHCAYVLVLQIYDKHIYVLCLP